MKNPLFIGQTLDGQPLRQEVEHYLTTLGFYHQPMHAWEAWVPRAHYLYVRRDGAQPAFR